MIRSLSGIVVFVLASACTGFTFGGIYEQISRSSSCEIASPVFADEPVSVGVVPAVPQSDLMGFFVDGVVRTGSYVRVSWVTDVPPPYELVYGFNTTGPTGSLSRLVIEGYATSAVLPVPDRATILHVQIGSVGVIPVETRRSLQERRRVFTIPALVVREYYYDVLSRRTSPYKSAYTLYPSDSAQQTGSGYRAILFSRENRFQYQIGIRPTNGGQTIVSRIYEDENEDALNYGVGYRMTCTPSSDIRFERAFSTFPDRSDAKIVRIR